MKKSFKWFFIGFLAACLTITPLSAFADSIQVTLNSVNISLDGKQVSAKGQSYILDNGVAIPYSLNYNGTVYLPIRKVSELVGKNIAYDGSSSTISISEKSNTTNTDTKTPEPVNDSNNTTTPADNVKQDTATSDKSSGTSSSTKVKSGYAIVNDFPKVKNESNITVNQFEGFIDGYSYRLLTSKPDMITLSDSTPAIYSIQYNDKAITEMSKVSPDATDTIKTYSDTSYSIEGTSGKYEINPSAFCYRVIIKDGSIDYYKVSDVMSLNSGYKVYLYETGGAKGYDIVIYDTAK